MGDHETAAPRSTTTQLQDEPDRPPDARSDIDQHPYPVTGGPCDAGAGDPTTRSRGAIRGAKWRQLRSPGARGAGDTAAELLVEARCDAVVPPRNVQVVGSRATTPLHLPCRPARASLRPGYRASGLADCTGEAGYEESGEGPGAQLEEPAADRDEVARPGCRDGAGVSCASLDQRQAKVEADPDPFHGCAGGAGRCGRSRPEVWVRPPCAPRLSVRVIAIPTTPRSSMRARQGWYP